MLTSTTPCPGFGNLNFDFKAVFFCTVTFEIFSEALSFPFDHFVSMKFLITSWRIRFLSFSSGR